MWVGCQKTFLWPIARFDQPISTSQRKNPNQNGNKRYLETNEAVAKKSAKNTQITFGPLCTVGKNVKKKITFFRKIFLASKFKLYMENPILKS